MIRRLVLITSLLVTLATGLAFGSLNTSAVSLDLAFARIHVSLALLLAAFFVAGVLLGALWMLLAGVVPARIRAKQSGKSAPLPNRDHRGHV